MSALVLSLLPIAISSAADVPDEQFSNFPGANSNQVAAYWTESIDKIPLKSELVGSTNNPSVETKSKNCNSIFDAECRNFDKFNWSSYFDFCDDSKITSNLNGQIDNSLNCIQSVFAVDSDGKQITIDISKSELIHEINPDSKDEFGGVGLLIPKGSRRSIIQIPGVTNKGGTNHYLVDVFMSGDLTKSNLDSGQCATQSNYKACFISNEENSFFASIKAVVPVDESNSISGQEPKISKNGTFVCVAVEKNICWKPVGFSEEFSLGLNIKISIGKLQGWLHGRVLAESFSSNAKDSVRGQNKIPTQNISLLGKPSKVAIAGGLKDDTELTDMMSAMGISTIRNFFYNSFWTTFSLDRFIGFQKLIGDTALASPQIWSFRNIRLKDFNNLDQNTKNCIKNENDISGYVSTNSTAYDAGPPKFNKDESSLDYRVASTHFNKDGSLNKGNYSLAIRNKVARCIYGFSTAPTSATVSIVSDAKTTVISTSVIKSNEEWLSLKADNFTYSAPTVRVKIKSGAETNASDASPSNNPIKKSTITCIKGKTTKKITALTPKCPAGYKKK